ncbi:MAG: transposase, partial [Actinobacteria bacterium]|nr:transposase [Actinomycetota bacterium]
RQRMRKHFECAIGEGSFGYHRREDRIAKEAALDGFYVIRTSLPADETNTPTEVVRGYKRLAQVERVFRTMKTTHLLVGPIRHWTEPRVRAHIFLCMLAAHVLWHLERRLEP